MSEIRTESMFTRYPFQLRRILDYKFKAASIFHHRLIKPFRDIRIKNFYKEHEIAEEKLDWNKVKKYRSEYMPEGGPLPWLDRSNAKYLIQEKLDQGKISQVQAKLAQDWTEDGYFVLEKCFENSVLDRIWNIYEQACYDIKVPVETFQYQAGDLFLGRCLDAHRFVPALKELYLSPKILNMMNFLLGVEAMPFQTIIGFAGSEQRDHSDSLHMSTYPLGYMAACWIAFEDIHPDSGPLVYYPGSQKLPYLFSRHLPEANNIHYKHTTWYRDHYEPALAKVIEENKLVPTYFTAKKGDVLFWHANLIHGGSKRLDKTLSRKALVAHYFGKGAFCYSDRMEEIAGLFRA